MSTSSHADSHDGDTDGMSVTSEIGYNSDREEAPENDDTQPKKRQKVASGHDDEDAGEEIEEVEEIPMENPPEAALIPAENFVVLEANQRIGLLIEPGLRVCLEGDLAVSTRRGEIDILGHRISVSDEPVLICSQRSTGLLQIESMGKVSGALSGSKDKDAKALIAHFGKRKGAVVIVSAMDSTKASTKEKGGGKTGSKVAVKAGVELSLKVCSGQIVQDPNVGNTGLSIPSEWNTCLTSTVEANPHP